MVTPRSIIMEVMQVGKSPLQMLVLIAFLAFLIFPVGVPEWAASLIDTSLGMLTMFLITVALFIYAHPVLAVVYVLVAYELLRRSSKVAGQTAYIQYTPTQQKRDEYMMAMNPPFAVQPAPATLEEEVVQKMAPTIVTDSTPAQYLETSFRPVADDLHHAVAVQ